MLFILYTNSLCHKQILTTLKLRQNKLTTQGIEYIAQALARNQVLFLKLIRYFIYCFQTDLNNSLFGREWHEQLPSAISDRRTQTKHSRILFTLYFSDVHVDYFSIDIENTLSWTQSNQSIRSQIFRRDVRAEYGELFLVLGIETIFVFDRYWPI